MSEQVYLSVGDRRLYGWQEVSILHSMDALAAMFDISYSDKHENFADVDLQLGKQVTLQLGSTSVVRARIEDINIDYDDSKHSISAAGRSAAADLVDCALDVNGKQNKQFRKQKLDVIARELCQPFGIDVVLDPGVDVGEPLTQTIEEGQTIFAFLDQLARYRALRFVSDLEGRLHLSKPGQARSTTALELGRNIKRCSARFSVREVYSSYTILAQITDIGATHSPSVIARQLGRSLDTVYAGRHRPYVATSDKAATTNECQTRAQFEQRTRRGRGQSVSYTLQGWRDDQGQLWKINTLVHVRDPWLGIDGERLISDVRYLESEGGRECELTLKPLSAFEINAEPEKEQAKFL